SLPVAAEAQSIPKKIQSYCEGRGFASYLNVLLLQRCAVYSRWNPFLAREVACERAANPAIRIIDIDRAPHRDGETNFVLYRKKLAELLSAKRVQTYLEAVSIRGNDAIQSGERFSLWETTLEHTH